MLLRNQDRYLDMLHVDVVRDTRERREVTDTCAACSGVFFEHDDSLFALGAEGGVIYIILKGKLLKYDGNALQTQLNKSPAGNTFTVIHHSNTLCSVTYTPIKASGWIPNEDDECLDGFLWMHNVLQNPERCSLLIASAGNDG